MTSFLLPKSIRPTSPLWKKRQKSTAFWKEANKRFSWRQDAPSRQPMEHPGRKYGRPAGGWIWDLVELRKAIVLCDFCQPKFDHERAGYYKDRRFPFVSGKCDGCRNWAQQRAKIYIHQSFLGEPGGLLRAGQCWTPL